MKQLNQSIDTFLSLIHMKHTLLNICGLIFAAFILLHITDYHYAWQVNCMINGAKQWHINMVKHWHKCLSLCKLFLDGEYKNDYDHTVSEKVYSKLAKHFPCLELYMFLGKHAWHFILALILLMNLSSFMKWSGLTSPEI